MHAHDSTRRHSPPGIRLVLAALLLVIAGSSAASAAVLILPLGDSITHGGNGDGGVVYPTYRAWLYQDLGKLGYDVDFVGSLDQPVPPVGSDPHNEGHSAYTAGQVLAELPAWLGAYPPPEVALIHLGTNDAVQGIPAGRTRSDLQGIVAVLRARNPSMTILVAQIIPTSVSSINTRIEALNGEIAGLSTLSTPQSQVIVVDQYAGYDGVADNQHGGVHPLTSGEQKMTSQWEIALIPVLARDIPAIVTPVPTANPIPSDTVPAPPPIVVTTVPEPSPTVTEIATPGAGPRFGARSYRIGSIPSRTLSGGIGTEVGGGSRSLRVVPGRQVASTGITPPAKSFTRWYPAARWMSGLR